MVKTGTKVKLTDGQTGIAGCVRSFDLSEGRYVVGRIVKLLTGEMIFVRHEHMERA